MATLNDRAAQLNTKLFNLVNEFKALQLAAWNASGDLAGPLQGVLLHQLNAVRDRKLPDVMRTPILPQVLASTPDAVDREAAI